MTWFVVMSAAFAATSAASAWASARREAASPFARTTLVGLLLDLDLLHVELRDRSELLLLGVGLELELLLLGLRGELDLLVRGACGDCLGLELDLVLLDRRPVVVLLLLGERLLLRDDPRLERLHDAR